MAGRDKQQRPLLLPCYHRRHAVRLAFVVICCFIADCCSTTAIHRFISSEEDEREHNSTRSRIIPEADLVSPLFAHSGSHHIEIFVGQPPKLQYLIVDTGSRITSWLCGYTGNHGNHDENRVDDDIHLNSKKQQQQQQPYEPRRSSTAQTIDCGHCHFADESNCGSSRILEHDIDDSNNSPNLSDAMQQSCIVKQRYAEGSSWTGFEVNDVISLRLTVDNNSTSTTNNLRRGFSMYETSLETTIPFTFGCQTDVTGLFGTQFAHGILGLERFGPQTLPLQLYRHGVTTSNAFSLCLTLDGGTLGLGGAQLSKHNTQQPNKIMQWTPMYQNVLTNPRKNANNKTVISGMYTVRVQQVWLGDTCLTSRDHHPEILDAFNLGKGTIFDSGTTDTFLPSVLLKTFENAWLEQTTGETTFSTIHRTATYSYEEFLQLPDLWFVLEGGATLVVPASQYMEGASVFVEEEQQQQQRNHESNDGSRRQRRRRRLSSLSSNKRHILHNRLYTNEKMGAVLGINSMLNHDILFDIDNERIGIARATC